MQSSRRRSFLQYSHAVRTPKRVSPILGASLLTFVGALSACVGKATFSGDGANDEVDEIDADVDEPDIDAAGDGPDDPDGDIEEPPDADLDRPDADPNGTGAQPTRLRVTNQ